MTELNQDKHITEFYGNYKKAIIDNLLIKFNKCLTGFMKRCPGVKKVGMKIRFYDYEKYGKNTINESRSPKFHSPKFVDNETTPQNQSYENRSESKNWRTPVSEEVLRTKTKVFEKKVQGDHGPSSYKIKKRHEKEVVLEERLVKIDERVEVITQKSLCELEDFVMDEDEGLCEQSLGNDETKKELEEEVKILKLNEIKMIMNHKREKELLSIERKAIDEELRSVRKSNNDLSREVAAKDIELTKFSERLLSFEKLEKNLNLNLLENEVKIKRLIILRNYIFKLIQPINKMALVINAKTNLVHETLGDAFINFIEEYSKILKDFKGVLKEGEKLSDYFKE